VAARCWPDLGGIETHIDEVCRRLAATGDFEITVLATDRTRSRSRLERRDGFTVVRVPAWPRERDYYLAPGVFPVVRWGDWDLVHCQGIHTPVPVLSMLAARSAHRPYLVTLHTGGHSLEHRNALRSLQWRAVGPLLRRAERVIGVSRYEARLFTQAARLDPARVGVIQNGGSLPPPVDGDPVAVIPGRIVSVGRLERYKGHHRVIEALPYVHKVHPTASLEILGSGPYEAELHELAARLGVADAVTIRSIPPQDRTAMARALRSAEVMAALSDYEAHPVAVMEALTLGTPVVGYDVAGMADLVEDGLARGLAPGSSPERAAAALLDCMADGPGQPAPSLPTWETCAEQLAEVYRTVGRAAGSPADRPAGSLADRPAGSPADRPAGPASGRQLP
jgi:glycosyltransferase involved in cell wall biosynthesis